MRKVKEISNITGISVRTLHYYDEIGLLKPTDKSDAGYRLYDDKALERLQQILFFREFDIPLKEIKEVMENPALDRNHILQMQRKMLMAKIERMERLVANIDVILEKLAGKRDYSTDSFEVKEIIGEYGFVMKQLCQMKDEKEMMLSLAQTYHNEQVKANIDERYGDGAAQFFMQAIETFYI